MERVLRNSASGAGFKGRPAKTVLHVFRERDEAGAPRSESLLTIDFDFTGDLRLPCSNTSLKKDYGEKRNTVATLP